MFAKERQDAIFEMVQKTGAVTTAGLVEFFDVSIETIRRDLLTMEQNERLTRVHGGAVAKNGMKPFKELKERNKEFGEQKHALSLKAAEFISEGDFIGIDSGSTAISFAEVLKQKFSRLTVVTHSMDVFALLSRHKDFTVILCGGHYLPEENAFYGELTLQMLNSLHLQKVFVFPSAVSLKHGLYDYQKDLYQIQKQLMRVSDEVYILADSSKFEKTGLLKLGDVQQEHIYITDDSLPDEIAQLYQENHIRICTGGRKK
jgi:DeoR/GlpR family transcriptional regulator of sugar metabolism